MKIFGAVLLAVGFLLGAFVAVAQVDAVDWFWYGACAGTMAVGMVLLRRSRAAALRGAGDKQAADIEVLRTSVRSLIAKVRGFETRASDEEQLDVYRRIDSELMADIGAFVEARESMIPKLGMHAYAEIMSPFANGERLLNRAWSASADGYVDEVRSCIVTARGEFETAAAQLEQAAGAAIEASRP